MLLREQIFDLADEFRWNEFDLIFFQFEWKCIFVRDGKGILINEKIVQNLGQDTIIIGQPHNDK